MKAALSFLKTGKKPPCLVPYSVYPKITVEKMIKVMFDSLCLLPTLDCWMPPTSTHFDNEKKQYLSFLFLPCSEEVKDQIRRRVGGANMTETDISKLLSVFDTPGVLSR